MESRTGNFQVVMQRQQSGSSTSDVDASFPIHITQSKELEDTIVASRTPQTIYNVKVKASRGILSPDECKELEEILMSEDIEGDTPAREPTAADYYIELQNQAMAKMANIQSENQRLRDVIEELRNATSEEKIIQENEEQQLEISSLKARVMKLTQEVVSLTPIPSPLPPSTPGVAKQKVGSLDRASGARGSVLRRQSFSFAKKPGTDAGRDALAPGDQSHRRVKSGEEKHNTSETRRSSLPGKLDSKIKSVARGAVPRPRLQGIISQHPKVDRDKDKEKDQDKKQDHSKVKAPALKPGKYGSL